jgi:phosphoribosylformylglycinamidine synthase
MDKVPVREEGMTPYEMMLSESQERMLMVLKPGHEPEAEAIFRKWELDFAVIGEVTDTGRMVLEFGGEVVCDIPLAPLADDAPLYDRPHAEPKAPAPLGAVPESGDIVADLTRLMAGPDLASRKWIWQQYDHQVGADTVSGPGGDAAVVRVHGHRKALAITTDCTPRYCLADPFEGGKQAVAEAYRNLSAVGATPLAITNCLNFANPQRPEIMAQFVGCVEGMAEACRALDFPVVSGNVSLYNESKAAGGGSAILPTPAIGGVGLMADYDRRATIALKDEGDAVVLVGGAPGHLGQSLYVRERLGREEGPPPPVDLDLERRTADVIRRMIADGVVGAVHDVSDGGLAVTLAEMALAGGVGAVVRLPEGIDSATGFWFGEDQARYLVTADATRMVLEYCADAGIAATHLGEVEGNLLSFRSPGTVSTVELPALREAHEGFFKDWMEG